jgi:photosystem II stability/assembly factor-like uncharacterized protein
MADEVLVLRGEGNVDVQIGGPGNNWQYLSACAGMSGPEVPYGDTEIRFCQDPKQSNAFMISSKIRTAPDQITFDLMTKLGKVDYLKRLRCSFGLRARFAKCGEREDPGNYDPLMLAYCPVDLQSKTYEDLVITTPENQDEILVTTPASASFEYRIKKVNGGRTGSSTTLGDQVINDIEYCGGVDCAGYCGDEDDGCTKIYGVTAVDTTPYAAPNLIKGVKNLVTDAITWTNTPILGANSGIENIECAGSRLVISSNGDVAVFYNDSDGDQDEWNKVALTRTPSSNHNALFFRNAREGYLGCNSGYILKTVDGGATWNEVHSATLTSQNINALYAYDKDLVWAVGNNGVILKSTDGGQSWQDMSETSTTGANLLVVIAPPSRPKQAYIGTNNGRIYRTINEGTDWTRVSFDGDSVGTVDDLAFCGPCAGDVLWILHNDAGPRGRILRDLSGGAGGIDVETVVDYTTLIPGGVDLNALACCDVNEAIVGGALYGGYPVVIKVS